MYAFDIVIAGEGRETVLLLVQAQRGETLGAVLERSRERGSAADGIVVRTPVDVPMSPAELADPETKTENVASFLGDEETRFRRARERSVHVLASSSGVHHLTPNLNVGHPLDALADLGLDSRSVLDRIRECEMRHLVERSKALLTAPPESRFRAPSGHLVANFVRVGNVQRDRDAVDAIFFWMLPWLRDVDGILVDTWSISSIAFNAARAASAYFDRSEVRVEMLGGYVDDAKPSAEDARETVKTLVRAIDSWPGGQRRLLTLISATQSGDLAKRLESIVADVDPGLSVRSLAIFRLGGAPLDALADLSTDERFRLLEPEADRSVLEIDGQVYFPLAFTDVPVRLSKLDASQHREFFDAYRDTDVVRIHRDEDRTDGTGGHQAVGLDLRAIIAHPRFEARLAERLAEIPPPKAVLAAPYDAAQLLAEGVRLHFAKRGHVPPVMPTPRTQTAVVDERQRSLRELLGGCGPGDSIVVVVDVCITTASLAQIDKQLRTDSFEGRVHYVVGIARPADLFEWEAFVGRLRQRGKDVPPHTVSCIERIPLPDWNEDSCPWCREIALYDDWLERGLTLPDTLVERREAVAKSNGGDLAHRTFLHPPELALPELGDRSFFVEAPCRQADVFAATAAALQTLRAGRDTGQPKLGQRHFPIATPLDDQDYLEQKWTDTVIRAAILRGATRDELVWTASETEAERTRRFGRLLAHPDPHEHDVRLEILLAACMGKATISLDGAMPRFPDVEDDGTTAFLLDRIAERMRSG